MNKDDKISDLKNAQVPSGPLSQGGHEKPKNFKTSIGKLLRYCKKEHMVILAALLCAAAGAVFSLLGPQKLSGVTDAITEGLSSGIDLSAVGALCAALLVFYIVSMLLTYVQGVLMAVATQKVSKRLRMNISRKINTLPISYFNKTTTGDVLSRVTNDVDTISQTLNQSVGGLISALALFLGSLLMMLLTSVPLALAAVISTILGFVFMLLIMGKSQKYFTAQQESLGTLNGFVEETYAGHATVKAYNGSGEARARFEQINSRLRLSSFKAQCLSGLMMPLMSFIGNLGYVVVCVLGAVLLMNGSITFGVIVAFMLYIRLFTQPLSQLAQAVQNLQSAAAASERVFEFLDSPDMEDESGKELSLPACRGKVEFKDVSFSYEDGGNDVIRHFSALLSPGQKVAIVGETGAGKTTIVNLLMRFYEIKSGKILIDDLPIDQMTRAQVHSLFLMVLQDTWLFEGTIRENIVYCKQNVPDQKLNEALKAVGLYHFVRTLPQGLDTVLSDSANLSAGQKQQLTIARAMISDAPMLILDEATSSVDTRTERQIQRAMDQMMTGRTSFVIAHRLSTIKNADLILVMKDGMVIESGTHETLLLKNGFYAELYNSQFEAA